MTGESNPFQGSGGEAHREKNIKPRPEGWGEAGQTK